MKNSDKTRLRIGKIGKTHGVRGELRINSLTDFPERFEGMTEVYVNDELMEIKSVRYQNDVVLMSFKGIENREEAAALTGRYLFVNREDAVELEEGEYYTIDIIGLEVYDKETGTHLGTVTDVLSTGSNDVYVAAPVEKGQKDILIPALKTVVSEIDIDGGRMVVTLPEEMD
ncbi:MAG: ribosome maturation factor RimM [Selenomonadaceae bacterium]|nr:ribosome maturation factor RimM [Selenomonadaceae bacterium]